jgi:hypothetical protein
MKHGPVALQNLDSPRLISGLNVIWQCPTCAKILAFCQLQHNYGSILSTHVFVTFATENVVIVLEQLLRSQLEFLQHLFSIYIWKNISHAEMAIGNLDSFSLTG